MASIGPLLQKVLHRLDAAGPARRSHERAVIAAQVSGVETDDRLPVVLQMGSDRPFSGETWPEFKARIGAGLRPLCERVNGDCLYLANAVAGRCSPDQVREMADRDDIGMIELDPVVRPILMDDAVIDVGVAPFRQRFGNLTGEGVRVAVLDSGIDARHPFLRVADAISTSGEDVALPGQHGTHCAGSIASLDADFPGIAPGVTLLNVKVLRQDGSGQQTSVTRGVDAALDLEAQILSMSLGFNHLPTWSDGGHGWSCPDGRCPLCTAVDNATAFGALVCVAAGNEHGRAEALRRLGPGLFDTELGCPGQARGAISVGAMTKRSFLPAEFSSHGPSSYGAQKPDLVAPGVNVMSTIPVPRRVDGSVEPDPARADLFGRSSGTSMATPIVAGVVALILQHRRENALSLLPDDIRSVLLDRAVSPLPFPAEVVGLGRLDIGRLDDTPPVA